MNDKKIAKKGNKIKSILVLLILVCLVGIIFYFQIQTNVKKIGDVGSSQKNESSQQTNENNENKEEQSSQEESVQPKTSYTEEEKAFIESQEGVTIDENGVMQVDVGNIFE